LQTLARRLTQFRALPPSERGIVIAAMLRLPLFWIGLRLLGLQRLQARLQRTPPGRATTPSLAELQRIGTLVNAAANQALGPANCLTRSLYLWWLLRRRGVETDLRIGVRLADGALEAHAWVEHAGLPINDRPDVSADFPPFAEPVSPSRFTAP
jgi:hypothetical protein